MGSAEEYQAAKSDSETEDEDMRELGANQSMDIVGYGQKGIVFCRHNQGL